VIAVNIAMLVWFRLGTGTHIPGRRAHAANRSFWWLLAALALAYGAVLSVPVFTQAFAFPVNSALQSVGVLLMATGAAIAAALRWRATVRQASA
jgi:uncharacterized membrane protein YhaH (DUF805 family)